MSIKKLLRLRNRIAPNYPQTSLVLIIILSSIILSPFNLSSSGFFSLKNESYSSLNLVSENLPFIQEKMDLIVGKDKSIIASLELEGGSIETIFDLSSTIFAPVKQVDFIVSNQSQFSKVWTNPLWQFPDGLNIRILTRTTTQDRLDELTNNAINLIRQQYNLNLSLYAIESVSYSDTLISLVSPLGESDIVSFFEDIFSPYIGPSNGNMITLMLDALEQSPDIFAFGYSLQKAALVVDRIMRGAIVSMSDKITLEDGLYHFKVDDVFGSSIRPNPNAAISKFKFKIPFIANITHSNPKPDNVGASLTGNFEWLLKYSILTRYSSFDAEIIYYPSSLEDFHYPQVAVTNSYSDQLLEDHGILNMTYTAINIGSDEAIDTKITLPVPFELQAFITSGAEISVLNDSFNINESFSSFITLHFNYNFYDYEIPVLDIQGWYQNTATSELERWQNDTEIILDEYATVQCSNGISTDLYQEVFEEIQPLIDLYGSDVIAENFWYYGPVIQAGLERAVANAYESVFGYFYINKTLFNFEPGNFTYTDSILGGYLEATISSLDVYESVDLSWKINDIPTSNDKFGAFSIFSESIGLYEYGVFRTVESDYKDLMLTFFAQINSAGRFLSSFDELTQTFISLGSRYSYYDKQGNTYYGLTNGLNLQIGDDEAVLESSLTLKDSIYTAGDKIDFALNISNFGSIGAYDVHVDIVNLRLNYLWQLTDLVLVKSFDIDQIDPGENLSHEFSTYANSYIGLNTYVALISFTSDKDQSFVEITDPWTGQIIPWIYGAEARNIVSSTLTFGILLPPELLTEEARPSFPLPEISVETSFEFLEEDNSILIQYEITNDGLSPTNITVTQYVEQTLLTLFEASAVYIQDTVETAQSIIITEEYDKIKITYASLTLYPGESIIITITGSNLPQNFAFPPLIIDYHSFYEIITTDFQSIETQSEQHMSVEFSQLIKQSPSNITENAQSFFSWSTFSNVLDINFPISGFGKIDYFSLPMIYPLVSAAVITLVLAVVMIISKLRNRR